MKWNVEATDVGGIWETRARVTNATYQASDVGLFLLPVTFDHTLSSCCLALLLGKRAWPCCGFSPPGPLSLANALGRNFRS